MSYILDALRKADSERERGSVPGIHAQPVPVGSDDGGGRAGVPWWAWLIVGAFVLMLIALAWLLLERDVPHETPAAAMASPAPTLATPAPATPQASAAPSLAPAALATPPASAAPAAALAAPAPSPAPLPPAPAVGPPPPRAEPAPPRKLGPPPSPRQSADKASPAPPRERAKAAKVEDKKASKGSSAEAADPAVAGGPIYQFNDLPEGLRRELPRLPIGGSIHSSKASDRLLIINGQLFHEGDELAPGLMLEQIELKSAVLRYKGYRYRVAF